jgi:hypothetical protein
MLTVRVRIPAVSRGGQACKGGNERRRGLGNESQLLGCTNLLHCILSLRGDSVAARGCSLLQLLPGMEGGLALANKCLLACLPTGLHHTSRE